MFQKAAADYADLLPRCEQFNRELVGDARNIGGDSYASIVALAYRQAWAGCGFAADSHKQPLLFTKENTSNGDIATVDVIFPMDPIWMLLSPNLAKASLISTSCTPPARTGSFQTPRTIWAPIPRVGP